MVDTWNSGKGQSLLHEHRDEVLKLFREGLALKKIGAKFDMTATAVQSWLKNQGEECDEVFPFRPRKLYCTNLHARRANARDQSKKAGQAEKNRARSKAQRALYRGDITRPTKCERCGKKPKKGKDGRTGIRADHHLGYTVEHALDIWWICTMCDHEVEKLRKAGKTVNKSNPCRDDIH
jgi:hypothetical protein